MGMIFQWLREIMQKSWQETDKLCFNYRNNILFPSGENLCNLEIDGRKLASAKLIVAR
jgi:hypothetical protein